MADAIQTMIDSPTYGQLIFDAVLSAEHKSSATVTSHPVQYGAQVTDHAINEPDEVMLSIGMSDVMTVAETDHSINAFRRLKQIKEKREPVTLVTRMGRYENMIITSLSVPDDYTTMFGMKANIIFSHIEIVQVAVVTIQQTVSASKKSSKKKSKKAKAKTATPTTTNGTPSKEDGTLAYKIKELLNKSRNTTETTQKKEEQ